MNRSSPDKPKRSIDRTARFVCYAAILFAAPFPAAAQNSFTDAEADGIKAFLHDNFRQTNACMVIGLADQRGNRIFTAGKLENATTAEVNGDTILRSARLRKLLPHCCCWTWSSVAK